MISIIGAGPVGNYLASKLARNGEKVVVYEEHKKIGDPIACTGILTSYLKDFMKVDEEYIVNKINQTNVYSPEGKFISIKLKENFIVNREQFDKHLADVAKSNGAKYKVGKRVNRVLKVKSGYNLSFDDETVNTDKVVGADGPRTIVGRSLGIYEGRKFVVGHQARIKLNEKVDPNVVEFFLDEGNYIGWLVPEDERNARIGVASHIKVNEHFNELLKKRPGRLLGWQSGAIPIYNPNLVYEKKGAYLIGDAATQVKATTYGGIIPGLHAAELLTEVISNDIKEGSYQRGLKRTIGRHLGMHLMLRKVMNRFTKRDYNELIRMCENENVKKTIHKYDREYPFKLLMNLAIKQPGFAKFSKCLLRKEIN